MTFFRPRGFAGPPPRPRRRVLVSGALAGLLSNLMLAWLGRSEGAGAAAPLNAISHWLWDREALWQNAATVKYTLSGTAIHFASSLFWAVFYEMLRAARRRHDEMNAVKDALAMAAVAAVADLKCVPPRLKPGFEERLSDRGLLLVYLSFAAGLALGGIATLGPRSRP